MPAAFAAFPAPGEMSPPGPRTPPATTWFGRALTETPRNASTISHTTSAIAIHAFLAILRHLRSDQIGLPREARYDAEVDPVSGADREVRARPAPGRPEVAHEGLRRRVPLHDLRNLRVRPRPGVPF